MEEDFEVPENALDVFEIIVNGESRTFRAVTDLRQSGIPTIPEKVILDGCPREFEFDSIVRLDKKRTFEYLKTHTRCFGIVVVIDNLVEVSDSEDDENKDNMSYE